MKKYKKDSKIYRAIFAFIGVIIIGFGVSLLVRASLGTDPFSCLNLGISKLTGKSFGTCQLIMNIILLIFPLIFSRKDIGFGTVANMVLVGYVADFFGFLYSFLPEKSLVEEILLMGIGILVCSYGVAMYMEANLGIAPYDSLGIIIAKKFNKNYSIVRVAQDIICVLIGFLLGSTVGVATVLTALLMGYIITPYRKSIHEKFFS